MNCRKKKKALQKLGKGKACGQLKVPNDICMQMMQAAPSCKWHVGWQVKRCGECNLLLANTYSTVYVLVWSR